MAVVVGTVLVGTVVVGTVVVVVQVAVLVVRTVVVSLKMSIVYGASIFVAGAACLTYTGIINIIVIIVVVIIIISTQARIVTKDIRSCL